MTVCIAARCFDHYVIGTADRLKAGGDVSFEPEVPKFEILTNSIIAMTAGDVDLQAEIFRDLRNDINSRMKNEPQSWLDVSFVAELYLYYRNNAKNRRIAHQVLAPFGLNITTFFEKQRSMLDSFVQLITNQIGMFQLPPISCIITGLDLTGTHIYVVDDLGVCCKDKIGFASIGIGSRHAESQMMNGGHSHESSIDEAVTLVHAAKKRAEVSPGVGKTTDMFSVGNQLGVHFILPPPMIDTLETAYAKMKEREKEALEGAYKDLQKFFDESLREKGGKGAVQTPTETNEEGGQREKPFN
jgi:hypothetical protein